MNQLGFFDVENRLKSLSEAGDPLEALGSKIKWENFRSILEAVFRKEQQSEVGRPRFDVVMMFKSLILQSLYNLSDEQLEYQIRDRLSFMRFLGLGVSKRIPDQKTLWLFRQQLTEAGVITKLFKKFDQYLAQKGFHAKRGTLVDASLVSVPIQSGEKGENDDANNQIDDEASWTKKNGKSVFGYKNHIAADREHKLIRSYQVTTAKSHESTVFESIIDPLKTTAVWADSAYHNQRISEYLKARKIKAYIQRQGRSAPLSAKDRKKNSLLSKQRKRVEHIFAFLKGSMHAGYLRCIGLKRAAAQIGLRNLTYNMRRFVYLSAF